MATVVEAFHSLIRQSRMAFAVIGIFQQTQREGTGIQKHDVARYKRCPEVGTTTDYGVEDDLRHCTEATMDLVHEWVQRGLVSDPSGTATSREDARSKRRRLCGCKDCTIHVEMGEVDSVWLGMKRARANAGKLSFNRPG